MIRFDDRYSVVPLILFCTTLLVACGDDSAPDAGSVSLELVDPSLVSGPAGAVAYADAERLLIADQIGIREASPFDGRDLSGAPIWTASSTASGGPTATGLVHGEGAAFFLPSGQPQVGALRVEASGGTLLSEAVLADDLLGGYPADLELDGARSMLWVADAPFGAGSAVRGYSVSGFPEDPVLQESIHIDLPTGDLDDDGQDDTLIAGKLVLEPEGRALLVAFTVLGNTASQVAGGVIAFDPSSGAELGRVLVPVIDTSTSAVGFVGGLALSGDRLFVISAEKQFAPTFEERAGRLFSYTIDSWDGSTIAFTPTAPIETREVNPIGLSVLDNAVVVVEAPFFAPGMIEVFDLDRGSASVLAEPVDAFYVDGFSVPGDPVIAPDGSAVMVFSEAGVVKLGAHR